MTTRIRLADLERPAGEVELLSGRTVRVRAIDGAGQQLLEAIERGESRAGDVWVLAARLLPDATSEEIQALQPEMIAGIAQIACGNLEAVLKFIEANERGKAAAPGPTAPSSAPAIGSPASSSAPDAPSAGFRMSSETSRSTGSSGTSTP